MGANRENESKTNRETTWLKKICIPAEVFFRAFNCIFRQTPTGPGPFCKGCLFSAGVFPTRPFFLTYFAGQDSAPVETDTSGPARLKAGQGV